MNTSITKKIRVAILSDVMDRRPERTLVAKRFVEQVVKNPEFEVTLVHFKKMTDEPLYDVAHEIIIPRISLPWGAQFASFMWWCLRTKERFDIFHWFVPRLYPFFWLVPAKKLVVTAYGGGAVTAGGIFTLPKFFFNFVLRHFNRYLSAVIGSSDFGRDEIAFAYRVPKPKLFSIYVGTDAVYRPIQAAERKEILSRLRLPENPYFLYVGGLQTHKNVHGLIDAFSIFRKDNPSRSEKLVIVGRASYGASEVNEALKRSEYAKDVLFIDYVALSDMPAVYSGALALILASFNEGLGLPLVEAMACATPVIGANAASIPEVMGGAGLLVNPFEVRDIARVMGKLAGDEALQKELSKRGIERAKYFTWEKHAEEIMALYKKLLSQ